MHLSDTNSIVQHLKKSSLSTTEYRKILTENTILEQDDKQTKLILDALPIRSIETNLIELIVNPVLMYLNIFSYLYY